MTHWLGKMALKQGRYDAIETVNGETFVVLKNGTRVRTDPQEVARWT